MSSLDIRRWRKRPVEIQAVQFDGTMKQGEQIAEWSHGKATPEFNGGEVVLHVETLNGLTTAYSSDYIIRGPQGDFYPSTAGVFNTNNEAL